MGRIIIASIVGSFAMYVTMSIAFLSPVAQIGFRQMAHDGPVLSALQTATANQPGLYAYPSVDPKLNDYLAKTEAARELNPSGILIYQPPGSPSLTERMLVTEYIVVLVLSAIAALLLSLTAIGTYAGRVGFVGLLGTVAALTTNVSYWNWYSFPTIYTLANIVIEIVSFVAAGLLMALLLRPRAA